MDQELKCPHCQASIKTYKNPVPAVDIIIRLLGGIVMIKRANPPFGWALPGGFVDWGETLEEAAEREAFEETGLKIFDLSQFRAYSDPDRDPRQHVITMVFTAEASGQPEGADDALLAKVFLPQDLPDQFAFDHGLILSDYLKDSEKEEGENE